MKRLSSLACASAILYLIAGSAVGAQTAEFKPVEEKNLVSGKQTLTGTKGYIYIQAPIRTYGVFIKAPDEAEEAEYEADWKEQFDKAVKKFPGKLKNWQLNMAQYEKTRMGRRDAKPIEPTAENFSIPEIERRMLVTFGPQFVYSKANDGNGKEAFSYLIEVEPGSYTYYGPMIMMPGSPPIGQCYCMGSVKFDVPAGEVTSLGDFLAFQWVNKESARLSSAIISPDTVYLGKPVDYSVPDRLSEFGAKPADLRAAGKMNNFFGAMIGRMAPVDGVLAYDRDTPVDVKGLVKARVDVMVPEDIPANPVFVESADADTATTR